MTDPLLDYDNDLPVELDPVDITAYKSGIPESIIYTLSIQASQDRMYLYRQWCTVTNSVALSQLIGYSSRRLSL